MIDVDQGLLNARTVGVGFSPGYPAELRAAYFGARRHINLELGLRGPTPAAPLPELGLGLFIDNR